MFCVGRVSQLLSEPAVTAKKPNLSNQRESIEMYQQPQETQPGLGKAGHLLNAVSFGIICSALAGAIAQYRLPCQTNGVGSAFQPATVSSSQVIRSS